MLIGHHRATRTTRERRSRRAQPRRPVPGLVALILLSLLATFFAWVSAEPLWLAVGHGSQGTATVVHCTGHGLDRRCRATFSADGAAFTAPHVDLVGVPVERLADGARVAARMVSPSSRLAYAGSQRGLALRWALGLGLMLLCGIAIALATGAHRLPLRRARWYATLASLAGPVLIMLAMLAVTR
jgi:hypothetical protein